MMVLCYLLLLSRLDSSFVKAPARETKDSVHQEVRSEHIPEDLQQLHQSPELLSLCFIHYHITRGVGDHNNYDFISRKFHFFNPPLGV